ncbi:hypothetical protein P4S73_09490 [Paraglaciecola sp. Hal342]
MQLNAVNNFGLKASGKLLGTITVLDAFGGGLGIWATGAIYDAYGSYQNAFMIFCVLVALSVVLISQVKKARVARYGTCARLFLTKVF